MKAFIPNIITSLNLFSGCAALVSIFQGFYFHAAVFIAASLVFDFMDGFSARLLNVKLSSTYSFIEYAPALLGFVVTVFAALRLAKFNIDQRQEEEFRGLSTPPATVFTLGLLLIHYYETPYFLDWISSPIMLFSSIAVLSFLLISDFPMFAMKNKSLKWKGNEFLIILMLLSILLFIIFKEAAFSLNVVLYIVLSFIKNGIQKTTD